MPAEPGNPPPAGSVRLRLPLARASGARPDPSGHEGHGEGGGPLCVRSHVRVRAAACTSGAGGAGAEMWPLTESQLSHACHFVVCSFRVHLSELGLFFFFFCYLTDEAVMVQRA